MTTAAENERLGVLETKVGRIEADVADIKADVKALLSNQQNVAIDLAARAAADAAVAKGRTQTGVWVRFFTERGLSILALAVSFYAIVNK